MDLPLTVRPGTNAPRRPAAPRHLCFYPGTRIATSNGDVPVERLAPADLVMTGNGPMPVRWVGENHVFTHFADPLLVLPIRIRAGALGEALPARDLLLSPDHAICLCGVLVHAVALLNGESIVREDRVPGEFIYYHVELATHELLRAEGVAAESFVDTLDRVYFHNWSQREAAGLVVEMPTPRVSTARQVPRHICLLIDQRRVALTQNLARIGDLAGLA